MMFIGLYSRVGNAGGSGRTQLPPDRQPLLFLDHSVDFSQESLLPPSIVLQNQMQAAFSNDKNADPCVYVDDIRETSRSLSGLLRVHVITGSQGCENLEKAKALATLFSGSNTFWNAGVTVEVVLNDSTIPIRP